MGLFLPEAGLFDSQPEGCPQLAPPTRHSVPHGSHENPDRSGPGFRENHAIRVAVSLAHCSKQTRRFLDPARPPPQSPLRSLGSVAMGPSHEAKGGGAVQRITRKSDSSTPPPHFRASAENHPRDHAGGVGVKVGGCLRQLRGLLRLVTPEHTLQGGDGLGKRVADDSREAERVGARERHGEHADSDHGREARGAVHASPRAGDRETHPLLVLGRQR